MSDEYDWSQDAEVVADRQLQAASLADSTRTRRPVAVMGGPIVTQWRCAGLNCTEMLDVTEDAVHALTVMSAELVSKGQAPLEGGALCEKHSAMRSEGFAAVRAQCQEALPRLIRQLKDAENPAGETAVIAKLRRAGHPDVDGLLALLGAPTKKRARL